MVRLSPLLWPGPGPSPGHPPVHMHAQVLWADSRAGRRPGAGEPVHGGLAPLRPRRPQHGTASRTRPPLALLGAPLAQPGQQHGSRCGASRSAGFRTGLASSEPVPAVSYHARGRVAPGLSLARWSSEAAGRAFSRVKMPQPCVKAFCWTC